MPGGAGRRHDPRANFQRLSARPRGKAEALNIIARHRHLHHLDRAAGKSELHPHERAGARPGKEIVSCGEEEPLVVQLALDISEKRISPAFPLCAAISSSFGVTIAGSLSSIRALPLSA
jgi:hypothetical protein